MSNKTENERDGPKYRLLQAAALIELYRRRMEPLTSGPIDPRTAFSHKELVAQIEAIEVGEKRAM
jgi:hypothetical protein